MMRLVIVTAVGLVLGTGLAGAEPADYQDRFMKDPPRETVYATDRHVGFSVRSTLIRWLGGVTIVDENDLRAAERERWWGADVSLLPADVVRGADR